MGRNPSSPCSNLGSQIIPFMCPVKDCSPISERSISSSCADTQLMISGHWLSRHINEMSLPGYSYMLFPLFQQGKKKGRSGLSGFPTITSKPGIKPRSQPVPEQRVLKCQEVIPKVPGALLWHHPPPCTVSQTQWVLCQLKKYTALGMTRTEMGGSPGKMPFWKYPTKKSAEDTVHLLFIWLPALSRWNVQ